MTCSSNTVAIAVFVVTIGLAKTADGELFIYHDYDGMVAELASLAATYPGLAEHSTAQDLFGLPTVPDGALQLSHHILRITNESTGLDKPEVLLVGVQHGNEVVSLEVIIALARLLLENYGQNQWLTELVNRREIYLMPMLNPHGFNHGVRNSPGTEGSEDMNRDHIYDRCDFACQDDVSLSTIGARAAHELARRHLFRVLLDYHGGVEMIIYPWGTPLHTAITESPDDTALFQLGLRMTTYGGSYSGLYPVGTSNDLLGAVYGPIDDSGYASSWDPTNADPAWPTDGWRALAYTVEISNAKMPPASTLGGDADILTTDGAEDGYVPKNVRIGLAAIDIAEPYILWTNRDQIPTQVTTGASVDLEWQVRGCFQVDDTHIRIGTDPNPLDIFQGQSPMQSQTTGTPCFGSPTTFSETIDFDTPGIYYLTPAASVDSNLLSQTSPVPSLPPQSWLVRSRTEGGFFFENDLDPSEVNTVSGRLYWGAEPLQIIVGGPEIIHADGFENGDLSWWNLIVP